MPSTKFLSGMLWMHKACFIKNFIWWNFDQHLCKQFDTNSFNKKNILSYIFLNINFVVLY